MYTTARSASRSAQHRGDRELGPVVGGRIELVELGCPLALRVGCDPVVEIPDRRDAGEELLVVEGDAVVAAHQSEPGLGPGGDLGDIALALDRPTLDQVGVQERGDGVQIHGDVEIGTIEQVVHGGLQLGRRPPRLFAVSVGENCHRFVNLPQGGLPLGDRGGGIVLSQSGPQIGPHKVDPALAVGRNAWVIGGRQRVDRLGEPAPGPRQTEAGSQPLSQLLPEIRRRLPGNRSQCLGDLIDRVECRQPVGLARGAAVRS